MLVWNVSLLTMNMLYAQENDQKESLLSAREMIHGDWAVHGSPQCYTLLGKCFSVFRISMHAFQNTYLPGCSVTIQ